MMDILSPDAILPSRHRKGRRLIYDMLGINAARIPLVMNVLIGISRRRYRMIFPFLEQGRLTIAVPRTAWHGHHTRPAPPPSKLRIPHCFLLE